MRRPHSSSGDCDMKMLFWKEFRQHWMVFVVGLCLTVPLPVGYTLFGIRSSDVTFMKWQYTIALVYALLIGSNLVASETHGQTIRQMFTLPYAPLKIWLSKYVYGFATTAVVFVCAGLVGILCAAKTGDGGIGFLRTYDAGESLLLPISLLRGIAVFSVSLVVSTLATRPIEAVVVAPLCYGWWWTIWQGTLERFGFEDPRFPVPFHLFFITACTCSSALIFVNGAIHAGTVEPKIRVALFCFLGAVVFMVCVALFMKVLI